MKKSVWLVLAVLLALGVGAYLLVASGFFQKSEEETVERFTEAFENGDYEAIYPLLTKEAKDNYEKKEVSGRTADIYGSLKVENVKLKGLEAKDTEKKGVKSHVGTLVLESTYGNLEREFDIPLVYNQDENDWFIDWSPNMIIPDLDDGEVAMEFTAGERGEILASSGTPLASNGIKETVGYIAGQTEKEEVMEASDVLDMKESALTDVTEQGWIEEGQFVPLKDAHRFNEEKREEFASYGLSIREYPSREYTLDEAAFHLIGYVGPVTAEDIEENEGYSTGDMIGKRGLEQLYEERLKPKRGYTISIVDDAGNVIETLFDEKAEDGEDITLTIDETLQSTVYSKLSSDSGASVAVDPDNGDILSAVSYPAPSPYDFMFGISTSDYEELETDKDQPLLNKFNRAASPGSTQKLLTALIAMNTDGFDPDANMEINGKGWQKDASWGGYEVNRYHVMNESFDLKKALTYSDNIYMARTALEIGSDRFIEGMKDLGIGHEYDTDYPIYTSQVSNEGTIDSDILLADTSYGQGELLISPIQIATIYAGVVNGGDIHVPHVLADSEMETLAEDIAPEEDLDYLESAMRDVVKLNHPDDAERDYAQFAGKTGTSENKSSQDARGEETGWFIGYDQNEKDMMLSLYVEEVEDRGMSEYTAKKFAEIHDELREQ
ncbi:PBP2a family beta-lactam-resistant peptidoglycan transpeptidase MecA [Salinicoccus jeotgali]|uniref:PBP2a family beta-lactam-resistant peptidoglycan transpeptidase MecA n=1 Tax=Salinicoccus jeotgali TaxID=381634 RepID=A0ABP7F798_9STAP